MTSTSAVATIDPERAKLRAEADAALGALTPNESAFVTEYLAGGNATEAATAAGYADPAPAAHRLRRRAKVQRAIRALVLARDAEAALSHEQACNILETAIRTRIEDFGVTAGDGTLIDFKDPATLSDGQLARVRRMEAKVHRSAKGQRGGYVWLRIEMVPVTELVAMLAKLRNWTSDAPEFRLALLQVQQPPPSVNHSASLRLVHDLAEQLLQAEQLDKYLIAYASGRLDDCARLLREGAVELRACAQALPVEASRG